jgi:hypothetical protein
VNVAEADGLLLLRTLGRESLGTTLAIVLDRSL